MPPSTDIEQAVGVLREEEEEDMMKVCAKATPDIAILSNLIKFH